MLLSATGFIALSTTQVTCEEFSHCYVDVGICLWTEGSPTLTQSAAQTACRQRNNAFLPRVTDRNIQNKLGEFRRDAGNMLHGHGFWIDVSATATINAFRWIENSPLAGWFVSCSSTVIYVREEVNKVNLGSIQGLASDHCDEKR